MIRPEGSSARARAAMTAALLVLAPGGLAPQALPACSAQGSRELLSGRPSPLDSLVVPLGAGAAKICYSRPSVRGRTIFDGLVPFGKPWRTGANEPTMLHLEVQAEVAGVRLAPGRYVVTTVPGPAEWTVIFHTTEAQDPARMFESLVEVGRGRATPEPLDSLVEQLTIRVDPGRRPALILEWERVRVRIPMQAVSP
ncbi:MAG TPA: DUF2911 domain-containing protein [Gemmatimonadales bacterium]|nr:DUF2911 domain-containing protein [Gemmatimonadales bacterium]